METAKKDQHEDLKQWLRRYVELERYSNMLWDRVDELRTRIQGARTANLDGMPHGSRSDADRLGADLARLEELELEAKEAQTAATNARREIEAAIKKITAPRWADRREILRLRYIDGLKWEDVTERLFGDDPKFWDRPDAFLRRAFKLHTQALEELTNYVPLEAGQENNT